MRQRRVLVLVQSKGCKCTASSEKVAWQCMTEPWQGREKRCLILDWRLKCLKRKDESLKVWPGQILPLWWEKPTLLIYHFWQQRSPECKRWVIISRTKKWCFWGAVLGSEGFSPWPCQQSTSRKQCGAGHGQDWQQRHRGLFNIAKTEIKSFSCYAMLALPQQGSNQYGQCKVNGLFQGVLNWAL